MRGALNTYQANGRRYFRRSLVGSASLVTDLMAFLTIQRDGCLDRRQQPG